MNRVVSLTLLITTSVASPARASTDGAPFRHPPGTLRFAVELVKAARARGKIIDCPTERCRLGRRARLKTKGALLFVAWTYLRKRVGAAAMRGYLASYATRTLARYGLIALGLGAGAQTILAISVLYNVTVDSITPLDDRELADDILFNAANRDRLLALPTAEIVMLAESHPVLGDQLVVMAHQILEAAGEPVHPPARGAGTRRE